MCIQFVFIKKAGNVFAAFFLSVYVVLDSLFIFREPND